jgi:cell division protein FtsQ
MSRYRQRNTYSVIGRICRKLFVVLLIIGLPAAWLITTFSIKNVEVVGVRRYTPDQMKEIIIQTKPDTNALYLYLKNRYFYNLQIPFVEKVDIEMVNTHSITIFVYEKMVAGCIEFMGEYLYFDKDGIIVESSSRQIENVPIIKGLKYNKIILSEKLEVQKEELFDVIMNLTQHIEKYDLGVDTISFNNKYEVTIDCGDIKVLLGKKSTYDEVLSELKNMLVGAKDLEITIDLRNFKKGSGGAIAKPKNPTE